MACRPLDRDTCYNARKFVGLWTDRTDHLADTISTRLRLRRDCATHLATWPTKIARPARSTLRWANGNEFTLGAIAQNLRRLAKLVPRPPPAIETRLA